MTSDGGTAESCSVSDASTLRRNAEKKTERMQAERLLQERWKERNRRKGGRGVGDGEGGREGRL